MGRQIVTERDVQLARTKAQAGGQLSGGGVGTAVAQAETRADPYGERLLKSIPAEVIAVYVSLAGVLATVGEDVPAWLPWGIVVFLTIATPLYLYRVQNVKKTVQLVISTFAFVVWVFSMADQSPFSKLPWYEPIYPAVLLPAYTFLIAIIKPQGAKQ